MLHVNVGLLVVTVCFFPLVAHGRRVRSSVDESMTAQRLDRLSSIKAYAEPLPDMEAEEPVVGEVTDGYWQAAIDKLKADIGDTFVREPNWDLFAEDFQIIDFFGAKLEGKENLKMLWKLLRSMKNKFKMKSAIEVEVASNDILGDDREDTYLVTKWRVKLGGRKHPMRLWRWLWLGPLWPQTSIVVEADIHFHINDQAVVDFMQIDRWQVNGQLLQWPSLVNLYDETKNNLRLVEIWIKQVAAATKHLQVG